MTGLFQVRNRYNAPMLIQRVWERADRRIGFVVGRMFTAARVEAQRSRKRPKGVVRPKTVVLIMEHECQRIVSLDVLGMSQKPRTKCGAPLPRDYCPFADKGCPLA